MHHILSSLNDRQGRRGFTIVELVIVIAVIAILASIVTVSYGGWKRNTQIKQVKSDLSQAASAMETAKNFGSGYPLGPSLPSTFTPSSGVTVTIDASTTVSAYCLNGTVASDATVLYYIDNAIAASGAQAGTCATRATNPSAPSVPTGLAIVSSTGSSISLTWTVVASATSYTASCASDNSFILGAQQTSSTSTVGSAVSATVSGLTPSSTFYCRVNATNSGGTSSWSPTVSTNTK